MSQIKLESVAGSPLVESVLSEADWFRGPSNPAESFGDHLHRAHAPPDRAAAEPGSAAAAVADAPPAPEAPSTGDDEHPANDEQSRGPEELQDAPSEEHAADQNAPEQAAVDDAQADDQEPSETIEADPQVPKEIAQVDADAAAPAADPDPPSDGADQPPVDGPQAAPENDKAETEVEGKSDPLRTDPLAETAPSKPRTAVKELSHEGNAPRESVGENQTVADRPAESSEQNAPQRTDRTVEPDVAKAESDAADNEDHQGQRQKDASVDRGEVLGKSPDQLQKDNAPPVPGEPEANEQPTAKKSPRRAASKREARQAAPEQPAANAAPAESKGPPPLSAPTLTGESPTSPAEQPAEAAEGSTAKAGAGGPGEAPGNVATRVPAAQGPQTEASPRSQPPVEPGQVDRVRFVRRVERAFQTMGQRHGAVRLRLSPPELGSLRLEISVRNGVMAARIEAETHTARNLLLDNLPMLRDRLAQQDIKIQQFDVELMGQSSGGLPDRATGDAEAQQRRGDHGPAQPDRDLEAAEEDGSDHTTGRPGEGNHVNVVI